MTATADVDRLVDKANELLDKADQILEGPTKSVSKKTTEIVVVLDRSGSMSSMKSDMEGGFNRFIEEQQKESGEAFVTLIQFDTEYETVYSRRPLPEVPSLVLTPRGGTALLDATGRAVCHALDTIPSDHLCVFLIITDGGENSSREFKRDQVKSLTKKCTAKRDWQFVYLGANQDAFAEGGHLGVLRGVSANYSADNCSAAMDFAASNVRAYRLSANSDDLEWKAEQREEMERE